MFATVYSKPVTLKQDGLLAFLGCAEIVFPDGSRGTYSEQILRVPAGTKVVWYHHYTHSVALIVDGDGADNLGDTRSQVVVVGDGERP